MKSLILVLSIITLVACSTKRITENPKDILGSNEITIRINHIGCFGESIQVIKVRTNKVKRILTNAYSREGNSTLDIIF